ncbi:MAG TPA: RusA family crossover junction endodeoxyribonuclease [Planctomycetaceae bacterium]|nr:RusA family crossover junction endodeoxyribonuclease [Planctomycetaceae bacterium]
MSSVFFILPGKPVGQGRPRMRTVKTKDGRSFASAYDPAKSRNYKSLVQDIAARALEDVGGQILSGPCSVHIHAKAAWPRSQWRKRTPRPLSWWTGKPDIDNIAKAILDAMSGVVYLDDTQVCRLSVEKTRPPQGEPDCVRVSVFEVGDGDLS